MHSWGDEKVDWEGINDAAYYIAHWLITWVRMPVTDYKEKFGTVRIYCGFGWHGIYSIWRPHYHWYPKWWPMTLDFWLADTWLWGKLNRVVVKVQQRAYAWRYKKAVQKWPHLYKEIVSAADWGELFEGVVPGYKHSDYWRTLPPLKPKKRKKHELRQHRDNPDSGSGRDGGVSDVAVSPREAEDENTSGC